MYYIRFMSEPVFEWDERKNQDNLAKPGVSFLETQHKEKNRIDFPQWSFIYLS